MEQRKAERLTQADAVGGIMFELSERDALLEEFDERLWLEIIDHAIVYHDGRMEFKFRTGTCVEV